MADPLYIDILIENDDLSPDAGGQPEMAAERACIAQDIVHMLKDSGLLTAMIGERNQARRRTIMVEITLLVDEDVRLVPGSTRISEANVAPGAGAGELWLSAETVDFGEINFALGIT